ncbi:MAG: DNA polymerase IV [Tetrasphaera sp.]
MPAWVLHLDMDQFIAAVEILRRPELAEKPLIVGGRGDPTERAVVSTASYEARAFGAHSGMPLRLAARKCPDAIILPVDHAAYDEASRAAFAAVRTVPDVVLEPLGWDEGFIGASNEDPEALARRIQATVLEATGLHCTIGIGDNKIRAKNATGFGKPRGVFRLTRENWLAVMGERPVRELWGVGSRISARLDKHGYRTVAELARADLEVLTGEFGPKMGLWYAALGRGEGSAVVDDTPWVARSHSRETTYQTNLVTPEEIRAAVAALVEQVIEDCAAEGRPIFRVGLKVRYAPFFTVNRSKKLAAPTHETAPVLDAVLTLVAALDTGREVRLLGVRGEMVMPPDDTRERAPTRARV